MGRDSGAASTAAATTSASWGAADCGGMAYNGGAAFDGGLAASSVASRTTAARCTVAARRRTAVRVAYDGIPAYSGGVSYNGSAAYSGGAARGVRPFAVVVTRSFPEIFPQLSDRFNHTNTRVLAARSPLLRSILVSQLSFFCAHQIAIFHLFDRQHRHSPDR